MKNKPILIVSGEPFSIFIEIFLKSIKKKKFNRKIVFDCFKVSFYRANE